MILILSNISNLFKNLFTLLLFVHNEFSKLYLFIVFIGVHVTASKKKTKHPIQHSSQYLDDFQHISNLFKNLFVILLFVHNEFSKLYLFLAFIEGQVMANN